jgi:hypothetical protein
VSLIHLDPAGGQQRPDIGGGHDEEAICITIVALTDAKKISANAQKVECTAMVILNSARKGVMNYSFTKDPSLGNAPYYIQASYAAFGHCP